MARIYYDADASLEALADKTIGILGFGSQGHAHALNLKDSGLKVIVGLREGSRHRYIVEQSGLPVGSLEEVARTAHLIAFLIPDTEQPRIYREKVAPYLTAGKVLLFAHGFNIHFRQIVPPEDVDVIMVAPKAPGAMVRQLYLKGAGTPALLAVHQSPSGKAKEMALAYAKGIGCTKAGVLETTFAEETETDLFGEQVVLCGGVTGLIKAAFETLVNAGYQPELAYFECLHELKLIVDLIYQGGLTLMRRSVSDTAKYGDLTRGPRVINQAVRQAMEEILKEIKEGTFAREWILENQAGRPVLGALMKRDEEHLIERVGKELRAMMSWLTKKGME